eukprot:6306037-Alexandrium_andersonii.AAC.1
MERGEHRPVRQFQAALSMLRAVPSRPIGWSSFESCQPAPRTFKQLRTVSGSFKEASSSSEQGSQLKQLGK